MDAAPRLGHLGTGRHGRYAAARVAQHLAKHDLVVVELRHLALHVLQAFRRLVFGKREAGDGVGPVAGVDVDGIEELGIVPLDVAGKLALLAAVALLEEVAPPLLEVGVAGHFGAGERLRGDGHIYGAAVGGKQPLTDVGLYLAKGLAGLLRVGRQNVETAAGVVDDVGLIQPHGVEHAAHHGIAQQLDVERAALQVFGRELRHNLVDVALNAAEVAAHQQEWRVAVERVAAGKAHGYGGHGVGLVVERHIAKFALTSGNASGVGIEHVEQIAGLHRIGGAAGKYAVGQPGHFAAIGLRGLGGLRKVAVVVARQRHWRHPLAYAGIFHLAKDAEQRAARLAESAVRRLGGAAHRQRFGPSKQGLAVGRQGFGWQAKPRQASHGPQHRLKIDC